jgi:hypothetical protein
MDQCDFPLLFPNIAKIAGMTGALQATHSKDINSRACLDFLYKNLLPPGTIFSHYKLPVIELL